MTKTDKLADQLLRGIRRELERLRAIDAAQLGRNEWRLRAAVNDAREGTVEADFPALLGRSLNASEHRAAQRAAERLEANGQIVRLRLGYDGARVTHLQLVKGCAPDARSANVDGLGAR